MSEPNYVLKLTLAEATAIRSALLAQAASVRAGLTRQITAGEDPDPALAELMDASERIARRL